MPIRTVAALIVVGVLAAGLGSSCRSTTQLDNSRPLYGATGLPKNCRAIIKANVDAFRARQYTAAEVIDSIDRNCGEFGYSWTE